MGVAVAMMVMSCQSDDVDVPVPQTQIQDQGTGDSEDGIVARYKVNGNNISLTATGFHPSTFYSSTDTHNQLWSFFTGLIPKEHRPALREFMVFADDQDGTAAYVAPLSEIDLSRWEMGFNMAYVWTADRRINKSETGYTSIHEFAHILTLDDQQVDASGSACNTFHTGEGCSNENSYINAFYNNYWTDIFQEHQRIGDNDDAFYRFYDKYQDRFVTEYAATNPGEDIAESFTMFVIEDNQPTGNRIADQKVRFFYQFDELITLRNKIRSNIDFEFDLTGVVEARSQRFKFKGKQVF